MVSSPLFKDFQIKCNSLSKDSFKTKWKRTHQWFNHHTARLISLVHHPQIITKTTPNNKLSRLKARQSWLSKIINYIRIRPSANNKLPPTIPTNNNRIWHLSSNKTLKSNSSTTIHQRQTLTYRINPSSYSSSRLKLSKTTINSLVNVMWKSRVFPDPLAIKHCQLIHNSIYKVLLISAKTQVIMLIIQQPVGFKPVMEQQIPQQLQQRITIWTHLRQVVVWIHTI